MHVMMGKGWVEVVAGGLIVVAELYGWEQWGMEHI
jgi:hypothetical protein